MTSIGQTPVSVADLRPVDLFDDLDDASLAEWAAVPQERRFDAGEVVIESGQEPEGVVCLLEGSLQMFVRDGDRLEPSGHQNAPTWIGAVPTLTETVLSAHMTRDHAGAGSARSPQPNSGGWRWRTRRCTGGSCARSAPWSPASPRSSRAVSALPRWGRWPQDSRTS